MGLEPNFADMRRFKQECIDVFGDKKIEWLEKILEAVRTSDKPVDHSLQSVLRDLLPSMQGKHFTGQEFRRLIKTLRDALREDPNELQTLNFLKRYAGALQMMKQDSQQQGTPSSSAVGGGGAPSTRSTVVQWSSPQQQKKNQKQQQQHQA